MVYAYLFFFICMCKSSCCFVSFILEVNPDWTVSPKIELLEINGVGQLF